MTTPIASFTVTLATSTAPVTVAAQTFVVQDNGGIVFLAANGQTVAAFANLQWEQVTPVVPA